MGPFRLETMDEADEAFLSKGKDVEEEHVQLYVVSISGEESPCGKVAEADHSLSIGLESPAYPENENDGTAFPRPCSTWHQNASKFQP